MDSTRYQLNDPYWSVVVVLIWALPILAILTVLIIIRSNSQKKNYPSSADTTIAVSSFPSSSSSSPPSWDVFLSFYGKDTRSNFTSHLYKALDQAGIRTFRDDPALQKGEEISPGLLSAIKDSKMFVVVLSENYARSPWCLDELVEILRCNRTDNQVVPVFYYVHPSDLRHQKGSFGEALEGHKKRYSVDTLRKWKSALIEIAKLSGYHLKKEANEKESDIVQEIVEIVARKASTKVLHLDEHLFGIDSSVEEIYQKLSMESNDVRAIGICGMGGIGKTTTAKAFYNNYSDNFDISCFIEGAKLYSRGGSPLLRFVEQLLIELLRSKDYKVPDVESGIRQLKKILCSKKALIVLDDLDQSSYSKLLVRLCNLFSAGNRIIFTTRDENLVRQLKLDIPEVGIYRVKILAQKESLELFSCHAFKKTMPPENFRELSVKFVNCAGGLPLALKVLGSSLRSRTDVSFWKAQLEKVRINPEIHKILKLSYDELGDETEKETFLDIVFFFVGKDKDEAVNVFKSCDFYPEAGIPFLVEKCLLTIDEDNKFQMHNLIQEMGRKVIREESKHGKCRRLYLCQENACKTLQNLEGTYRMEGLILDLTMSTEKEKRMTAKIFERMPQLRLLEIIDADDITGNFKNSFHELRCIRWHHCPWTRLPSSFHPQKLVSLDMAFSKFKILWKGPTPIKQLTNLGHLDLNHCCNLKRLPEQLGDIKGLKMLDLSFTAIERLPDSTASLRELVILKLYSCENLRNLPEQFGYMESLKMFEASESAIEQLPDSFGHLINLVDLRLSKCRNLTSLPNSIWKLKLLKVLDLQLCIKLERLPEELGKMQCLEKLNAPFTAIKDLPDSIGLLSRLQVLDLRSCKKLKYLPDSIKNLTSLEQLHLWDIFGINIPDTVKNMKLEYLSLRCNIRVWLPMILSFSSLKELTLSDDGQNFSSTEPFSLSKLSNLLRLTLENCASPVPSFPELPLNLRDLRLFKHATLEHLPDLSSLNQLKTLFIKECISLQSLSLLPPHLEYLIVVECTRLQHIPELSMLKELVALRVHRCSNLKSIRLKPSSLQVGGNIVSSFTADLPNREIAEWFSYKSSGSAVSFDFPPNLRNSFLGVALWIVYRVNKHRETDWYSLNIRTVITNKTEGITQNHDIQERTHVVGEAQSRIECISGDKISVKSGDKVEVSFQKKLIYYDKYGVEVPAGEVKVEMCGAHLILKTPSSTPC